MLRTGPPCAGFFVCATGRGTDHEQARGHRCTGRRRLAGPAYARPGSGDWERRHGGTDGGRCGASGPGGCVRDGRHAGAGAVAARREDGRGTGRGHGSGGRHRRTAGARHVAGHARRPHPVHPRYPIAASARDELGRGRGARCAGAGRGGTGFTGGDHQCGHGLLPRPDPGAIGLEGDEEPGRPDPGPGAAAGDLCALERAQAALPWPRSRRGKEAPADRRLRALQGGAGAQWFARGRGGRAGDRQGAQGARPGAHLHLARAEDRRPAPGDRGFPQGRAQAPRPGLLQRHPGHHRARPAADRGARQRLGGGRPGRAADHAQRTQPAAGLPVGVDPDRDRTQARAGRHRCSRARQLDERRRQGGGRPSGVLRHAVDR